MQLLTRPGITTFCMLSLFMLFVHHRGNAQYVEQPIQFSNLSFGGTARSKAFGGAQTAIGGDLGTMAGNPGGLGIFRNSEGGGSVEFSFMNSQTNFLGENTRDFKANFNFNNLGVVFTNRKNDAEESDWRSGTFGISLTRINNFHNSFSYQGTNPDNSLADYWKEQANGIPYYELETDITKNNNFGSVLAAAWNQVLIDTIRGSITQYYNNFSDNPHQEETVTTKGAQFRWDIGYGGNYKNKLYIGASLGIETIRYIENKTYTERPTTSTGFDEFTLEKNYEANGTGVNLKVGAIYKFTNNLRGGISLQTPTLYSITEKSDATLSSTFQGSTLEGKIQPFKDSYNLITPYRVNTGLAYFFQGKGFISADVEFVDYPSTFLYTSDGGNVFKEENDRLTESTKPTLNYRIGGEYRAGQLYFRGGFAHYGTPYTEEANAIDISEVYFTGGMGYRSDDYYIDGMIMRKQFTKGYQPYTLENNNAPVATTDNTTMNFIVTYGVIF